MPLTRELSTEEHILSIRGVQMEDSTELQKANPLGVVSSKISKIPRSIEDVTTVVLILQQQVCIANYTDSSKHYQWRFNITVIDWKTRCVIGHHTFEGEKPDAPPRKQSYFLDMERYGSQPWDLIRMWLYEGKVPTPWRWKKEE